MADQSTVKGGIERFRQAGRQHRWTTNIILGKRSQTHIFKSSKQGMHRKCQCWLGLDIKVEIDWNERLKNNRNILKLVLRRNRNSYFFPYLWPLLAKKKISMCMCVLPTGTSGTICMLCLRKPEVSDSWDWSYWQLQVVLRAPENSNLDHLKKYLSTDPCLQLLLLISFCPRNFMYPKNIGAKIRNTNQVLIINYNIYFKVIFYMPVILPIKD